MEGGCEARGSLRKKVKGRKEEKKGGGFIEEGKTASARALVGHKGSGL